MSFGEIRNPHYQSIYVPKNVTQALCNHRIIAKWQCAPSVRLQTNARPSKSAHIPNLKSDPLIDVPAVENCN